MNWIVGEVEVFQQFYCRFTWCLSCYHVLMRTMILQYFIISFNISSRIYSKWFIIEVGKKLQSRIHVQVLDLCSLSKLGYIANN
jgi:hypothetical protein